MAGVSFWVGRNPCARLEWHRDNKLASAHGQRRLHSKLATEATKSCAAAVRLTKRRPGYSIPCGARVAQRAWLLSADRAQLPRLPAPGQPTGSRALAGSAISPFCRMRGGWHARAAGRSRMTNRRQPSFNITWSVCRGMGQPPETATDCLMLAKVAFVLLV